MRREIPSVRILPMSDKRKGFVGRDIAQVQREVFLRDLPTKAGRFTYPVAGLSAPPGTVVLFQYQARVIASAIFVRDEKSPRSPGGTLHFEPDSFRAFDPVDADTMRKTWPAFRAFGHVKQFLNPGLYSTFKRRLKQVQAPVPRKSDATASPLQRFPLA